MLLVIIVVTSLAIRQNTKNAKYLWIICLWKNTTRNESSSSSNNGNDINPYHEAVVDDQENKTTTSKCIKRKQNECERISKNSNNSFIVFKNSTWWESVNGRASTRRVFRIVCFVVCGVPLVRLVLYYRCHSSITIIPIEYLDS